MKSPYDGSIRSAKDAKRDANKTLKRAKRDGVYDGSIRSAKEAKRAAGNDLREARGAVKKGKRGGKVRRALKSGDPAKF